MSLPHLLTPPSASIKEGQFENGFEYAILHHGMGYRCGYLKIRPDHPWYKKDYTETDCEVEIHGGLTYGSTNENDGSWWIGFDCAHSFDKVDPSILLKDSPHHMYIGGKEIRTTEYVEKELKNLADQAQAVYLKMK
jgi:hypothetical protein